MIEEGFLMESSSLFYEILNESGVKNLIKLQMESIIDDSVKRIIITAKERF